MPKYIIERDIPGAGRLTSRELQAMAQRSRTVLERLGSQVQWLESFVTDDRIYSVYIAPSAQMVLDHARQTGLPASRVSEVRSVIDPTTAETLPEIAG